jgi:Domain of unknown function (DUF4148)
MKSATPLMLATLAVASIGAFVSPAALANGGEHATMPDYSTFVSTKTRAEVRAEAIAARQAGLIAYDDRGLPPDLERFVSTKTRAQVIAELRETQRLGLMPARGEASEPVVPTAEQLRLIAEAGERAAAGRVAAVR